MFCTKCGNQLTGNEKFCINCGALLQEANGGEEKCATKIEVYNDSAKFVDAEDDTEKTQNETVAKIQTKVHTVVDAIKESGRSIVVLLATLLYTSLVLGRFINIFGTTNIDLSNYYMLGIDTETIGIFNAVSSAVNVFSVIGMTPMILILIGLWINYFQSYNKNGRSTAGLTMVKISMVIRLVAYFLVIGIIAIVLIALEADIEIYIVAAILLILALLLPIMYAFFVLSSIKSMKKTLILEQSCVKGLGGLCVMNYIFVALNTISLISIISFNKLVSTIVSALGIVGEELLIVNSILPLISSADMWAVLSTVIMIILLVLFSVNLSSMRKALTI